MKPAQLVLIPTLVGLNLVIGWIAVSIKLPIFLDSIGITLAAILAGPWIAIAVAVGTTLLGTVMIPSLWAFTGTAVLIAVLSSFLASQRMYVLWWRATLSGLLIAIVAAAASAPVAAYVFGGATASGVDAVTLAFRSAGNALLPSAFFAGVVVEPLDKTIAALAAFFLAHSLSRRTLAWFPGAVERIWGEPKEAPIGR